MSWESDVTLENSEYLIECDTLHYNTESEIAYFYGPRNITFNRGYNYRQ